MYSRQFGCIIAGDFLGAFIGAVLVWMLYLPHFKSVPEAPARDDNMLLRSKDVLADNALGFVSYNNREEDVASREQGFFKVQNAFNDIKYYLQDEKQDKPEMHHELASVVLGHSQMIGSTGVDVDARRHSIQVSDAHNRLGKVDLDDFRRLMIGGKNGKYSASESSRESAIPPEKDLQVDQLVETKRRLAEAAVTAGQNAKLSIFATRPAVYSPLLNFLAEFMATIALCYGALMIGERANMLLGPQKELFDAVSGFYLGFFIYLCVLDLGGPTGLAVNPARDFSPRLAHWILPIPGKGPSELYYCWIPIVAPLAGGCAAAGLYIATQELNKSNVS